MSKSLRPYQQETVDKVFSNLEKGIKSQLVVLATGMGKAQPLTAKVMTPFGWKLMKHLKKGDIVTNPEGGYSLIDNIYPQGDLPVYKVTFDDKAQTECCEDHLWQCNTKSRNNRKLKPFVFSLKELQSKKLEELYFPVSKAIQLPENKNLMIDPYLLGLLLGDGSLHGTIQISTADQEIIQSITALIPFPCKLQYRSKYDYAITVGNKGGGGTKNPIKNEIMELGLYESRSYNKFIPTLYLEGSIGQRIALLQGLMDTDGTNVKNYRTKKFGSTVVFTTVSKQLSIDITYLVRSLGGTAKTFTRKTFFRYKGEKKEGRISYNTTFKLPEGVIPFRLSRKVAKFDTKRKYSSVRKITEIEYVGKKECQCISLTSSNKLYITDDFIVTHNTLTATNIIGKTPARTLWITHREELIEQSALAILKEEEFCSKEILDFIESHDGIVNAARYTTKNSLFIQKFNELTDHIGVIKQDVFMVSGKITVASVQTLVRRLDKIPKDYYDFVIVDEAHLAMSNSFQKCIQHFDCRLRIGLTATPTRLDGMSLKDSFETITVNYDIKYGIDNGYLCELEAHRIRTDLSLDSVRTTAGELNQGDLDKLVNSPKRNKLVVESYGKYAKDRKAIMYCTTIQHAVDLTREFRAAGYKWEVVVSDEKICPNRKEIVDGFKAGKYDGLCNVDILTVGFDYPDIGCIGMVRPTKSLVVYLQAIGRGTRLKTEQNPYKNCVILDIVDMSKRHSLINTWTLDESKTIEDKIFLTKEKKLELIEKRNRSTKIEKGEKKDQKVNLLPLPNTNNIVWQGMDRPATDAQLNYLSRLGFDIKENSYTQGQAHEFINNAAASPAQIAAIKRAGYDVSTGCNIAQASKVFSIIKEKAKVSNLKNNSPFIGLR